MHRSQLALVYHTSRANHQMKRMLFSLPQPRKWIKKRKINHMVTGLNKLELDSLCILQVWSWIDKSLEPSFSLPVEHFSIATESATEHNWRRFCLTIKWMETVLSRESRDIFLFEGNYCKRRCLQYMKAASFPKLTVSVMQLKLVKTNVTSHKYP